MASDRDELRQRVRAASDAASEAAKHSRALKAAGATPAAIEAAQADFLSKWNAAQALTLELARRDDPRRQPTGRMPRRPVVNGFVRTGRTIKVDGVRVPVVEYVR